MLLALAKFSNSSNEKVGINQCHISPITSQTENKPRDRYLKTNMIYVIISTSEVIWITHSDNHFSFISTVSLPSNDFHILNYI